MDNLTNLIKVFAKTFDLEESLVEEMQYKQSPIWDSVGQMYLIVNLEEMFNIEILPEDIMAITSFVQARKILASKYGIDFNACV